MHERAAEFAERARDRHGIDPDVLEFDAGTETVVEEEDDYYVDEDGNSHGLF
jgi:hypothetical protein